jgi:DNA-directed RNA polymerase subunit K/omega
MQVYTAGEIAAATSSENKYESIMVAAAYARKLNELPKEGSKEWKKKYTTRALEDLVSGEIDYAIVEKRSA